MDRLRKSLLAVIGNALVLLMTQGVATAADAGPTHKELVRRGVNLWGAYCGYCHKPRPGSEFAPVQWETLMLHMRTRANLPAEDARAILEYIKMR
ncbi:MAG: hypothetical protein ACHQ9S_26565 [Candidatus Binatia bacterium]